MTSPSADYGGRPSAFDLWRQAGGGTADYDAERYRALLREHGHLVERLPGYRDESLPCGWPRRRANESAGDPDA